MRRLHDTFHKPFRRVSSDPFVGEDSAPSKIDENQVVESAEDSLTDKKEANMTVKSALSEAFAKYSSKIRSRGGKSSLLERESESKSEKTANTSFVSNDDVEGGGHQ